MTLRDSNNAANDLAIMQVLQQLLPVETQLAASSESGNGTEQIYIEERYKMSQGDFPAFHLCTGPQSYKRRTNRGYEGSVTIKGRYYDRWDQNNMETQDQIRARISADLRRMQSNLEDNDEVEYNGMLKAVSIGSIAVSEYDGIFDEKLLPGGIIAIYRELTMTFNILPYAVAL